MKSKKIVKKYETCGDENCGVCIEKKLLEEKQKENNTTFSPSSPPVLSARPSNNNSTYKAWRILLLGKTTQTISRLMGWGVLVITLLFASSVSVARAATDSFGYTWGGSAEYAFNAGAGDISTAGATYFLPSEDILLCGVTIPLKKIGAPTGTMTFSLRYSGGTPENGALLYSSTLDIATLTTGFTDWSITINNGFGCQQLNAENVFYFTVTTNQAVSNPATNYVVGKSVTYNNSPYYTRVAGYYKGAISGWSAGASLTTLIIETGGYTSGGDLFGTSIFPSSTLNFSTVSSTTETCSSGGDFFSSSTIASLGCHMKIALQGVGIFMFRPSTSTTIFFNDSLSSFTDVFPFNIFFNFTGILGVISDDYTLTDNTISLVLPSSTAGTITISSSTLNTFLGASNWTLLRQYEGYAIWILTMLGILATVGVFHHHKKK